MSAMETRNTLSPKLPRGFPRRIATIPGWATVFHVPRYISRVDVDEVGRYGTHGWQVRYNGLRRFFGDAKGRKRGSPAAALKEATAYLATIYQGPKVHVRPTPSARRVPGPVMEPGLRVVKRPLHHKSRMVVEVYVEAMAPARGITPRRVYVGTESSDGAVRTATPDRLEAAVQRARTLRAAMLEAYRQSKPLWKR